MYPFINYEPYIIMFVCRGNFDIVVLEDAAGLDSLTAYTTSKSAAAFILESGSSLSRIKFCRYTSQKKAKPASKFSWLIDYVASSLDILSFYYG